MCLSLPGLCLHILDTSGLLNMSLLSTMLPSHPFLLQQLRAGSVCSLLEHVRDSDHCYCYPNTHQNTFCFSGLHHCHRELNSIPLQSFTTAPRSGKENVASHYALTTNRAQLHVRSWWHRSPSTPEISMHLKPENKCS